MAIRIEPRLDDTEQLLGQVLNIVLRSDSRVAFLCPAGTANLVMARLRVMITRKRNGLRSKGKKARKFTLRSTVHTETHDGRRHDCVVIWRQVKDSDWLAEQLEDLMTNG